MAEVYNPYPVIQGWIKFGIACMAAGVFVPACGQSSGARPSAQGELTVTATVVSSVGVEIGPDGEQRIVVANAVDPRDNVSRLRTVNEKQDKLVFQGLKPLNIERSLYAGLKACSTPRGIGALWFRELQSLACPGQQRSGSLTSRASSASQ